MGKKASRGKKAVKHKVKRGPRQKPPEDPVLRGIIVGVVGERGYEIAREFLKKEITDEEAAKRLEIHVNIVRKVLYNLYENRMAAYRRDRDRQSGWYVYYWRIDPGRALEYHKNNKYLLLQKLEDRLGAERSTDFFSCGDGGHKLQFDLAAENDFKCPRCGGRMEPYDNSNFIEALEHKVETLRQTLLKK
ncbi:MAG: transcription factor [Hadesarchaea archaeon]|nr:transcription factor [Hadesarchaea archaeon]